jgi:DNA-binding GntR family transcriptional regulator
MAELLRDSVYRGIRHAILTCELQPGQELREQILAEKYRVSRSPIRDSLLRLEQEKLVTVLPRQGYRVNAISIRDVKDLCGLRLLIAPACAAGAARADDAAVRGLDRFRNAVADDAQDLAFMDYNRAFHSAVAELADNARIADVETKLVEEFDRLVLVSLQAHQRSWMPLAVAEHGAIIDAIQAHDSDMAYRLVYEHILSAQEHIMAAMSPEGPQQKQQSTNGGEDST